jgi:diacylglycerol kinase (ATP)
LSIISSQSILPDIPTFRMKKQKTLIIFNPSANHGRAKELEKTIHGMVKDYGGLDWECTVVIGETEEIAFRATHSDYKHLIAIGGDGTTQEIVNGLMTVPKEKRPSLGIVPIGSGNDFAGSLGISKDYVSALISALTGTAHSVDIGLLQTNTGTKRYWVNVVGIGFDAVVDIRTRKMVFFTGFWLYLAAAIQTILRNHTPYHFSGTLNGKKFERKLLMLIISNGKREGGGFKIAPRARQDDGELNYVGVNVISRPRMLFTLPYFLNGTQDQLSYVETGKLKKLEINADHPMQIHADGEIIAGFDSRITRLTIQVVPSAIHVIY